MIKGWLANGQQDIKQDRYIVRYDEQMPDLFRRSSSSIEGNETNGYEIATYRHSSSSQLTIY